MLSPREQAIVAVARLNSQMSAQEVARKVRMRAHSVHRTLRALRARGILQPFVLINPHALGLTDFCIFFNVTGGDRESTARVLQFCKQSSQVAYVAQLAGEYEFSVSIFGRSAFAVDEFISELSKKLPHVALSFTFAIRLSWQLHSFPRDPQSRALTSLTRSRTTHESDLDSSDAKLLAIYSRNAEAPLSFLAQKLGVSESTIHYRIHRLRERQIILGIPYFINWAACKQTALRALLSFRENNSDITKAIATFVQQNPRVHEVVRCLGAWDYELNFSVENAVEIGQFVHQLHATFGGSIQTIKTVTEVEVHRLHHFPTAPFDSAH